MTQRLTAIMAAALLAAPLAAFADNHEQDGPNIFPVETYTCTFNDGMGPTDLDAVVDLWNEWMDERGVGDYFASTLTPFYHGPDTFDFGWLGAWSDGNAMGQGTDTWLAEGSEIGERFAAVATCDTHSNFATMVVREPPEGDDSDHFVLTFSDCKVAEGKTLDDVFAGIGEFAAYQTEQGYNSGTWAMFAAYGGGGSQEAFHFKLVDGYDNHAQLGADYEKYANEGGYQAHMAAVDGLMMCDDARVYNGKVRRRMAEDE